MMKSRFDDVVVLCFFQQRVYITGPMIVVERLLNSLKNRFLACNYRTRSYISICKAL